MKMFFQSVNFNADDSLEAFAQKKMDKLDHYFDRIVESEVFLRVENTSEPENKISEVKINVPGNQLVAKKRCKTFEEGLDHCVDALTKQLKKHKEKLRA